MPLDEFRKRSTVDLKPLFFSIEGGGKLQRNQEGPSTLEKTGKIMGRWDKDTTNLSGFIERREKTNAFPITVINEAGQTKLTQWLSLENRLNLESLNEIFNGQSVDTEKTDSSIQTIFEPFPKIKLKLSQKNRSDKMKESHVSVYDKQERNIELLAPLLSLGTWSILKKEVHEYKTQTTYYPEALLSDAIDTQKAYIGKLQALLLDALQTQVEYERTTHELQTLTSTSNADYSLTSSKEEKFKSNLNYPILGTLFGAGYESDYLQGIAPSSNLKTQVTYSVWDKLTLWDCLSLKGTWNYSQNNDNETLFYSQKPELELDYRLSNFATFNLHYAYLTEFKPTSTDITENWNAGLKISVYDHLLISLNMTQENHNNPGSSLFQANSQVSVIF